MRARPGTKRGAAAPPASGARDRPGAVPGPPPRAGDVPAILQAIVRTAARLCEATNAHVYQVEGDQLRLLAFSGAEPKTAFSGAA